MARHRILDTNVLINHWRVSLGGKAKKPTTDQARIWAQQLIKLENTNLILSPILIEFLAGADSKERLKLYQAYLEAFEVLDEGKIPAQDWHEAKRRAQWIRAGHKRSMGDCLIQAIAERLNGDIITGDSGFPQRVLPHAND